MKLVKELGGERPTMEQRYVARTRHVASATTRVIDANDDRVELIVPRAVIAGATLATQCRSRSRARWSRARSLPRARLARAARWPFATAFERWQIHADTLADFAISAGRPQSSQRLPTKRAINECHQTCRFHVGNTVLALRTGGIGATGCPTERSSLRGASRRRARRRCGRHTHRLQSGNSFGQPCRCGRSPKPP